VEGEWVGVEGTSCNSSQVQGHNERDNHCFEGGRLTSAQHSAQLSDILTLTRSCMHADR